MAQEPQPETQPRDTPEFKLKTLEFRSWSLAEDLLRRATAHESSVQLFSRVNVMIGLPTAVLAGIAGVSAFTENEVAAGSIAMLVAALSAASTFLNPAESYRQHEDRARKCRTIARQSLNLYYSLTLDSHWEAATKEVTRLEKEAEEVGPPYPTPRSRKRVDEDLHARNTTMLSELSR
jgi:hypothetical protein